LVAMFIIISIKPFIHHTSPLILFLIARFVLFLLDSSASGLQITVFYIQFFKLGLCPLFGYVVLVRLLPLTLSYFRGRWIANGHSHC
jgi:hypothetical protein